MSRASATAWTCRPGRWLSCTAARLNSTPYRCVFFGPARAIEHLLWLGGSVYSIEGGSTVRLTRWLCARTGRLLCIVNNPRSRQYLTPRLRQAGLQRFGPPLARLVAEAWIYRSVARRGLAEMRIGGPRLQRRGQ